MAPPAVTIKDVAAAAGVSIATVSNVVHGKSNLYAEPTERRVRAAMESLGYRPNLVARSLARQRTGTIGAIIEHLHGASLTNPYMGAVLDGVLGGAIDLNYHVKIIVLAHQSRSETVALIEDGTVDGVVLLAPRADGALLEWAVDSNLPSVVLGSVPPTAPLAAVDVDDSQGVYDAVRRLIAMGHTSIGHIAGPNWQWSARRRANAYRMALEDAGLCSLPHWIVEGDYKTEGGSSAIRAIMAGPCRPTAVMCGNDDMAIGAMDALHLDDVAVPGEVSIVGFDDGPAGRWSRPTLTTVRQPMRDIGYTAAEVLVDQIRTSVRRQVVTLLPASWVERDSTGPPLARPPLSAP